MNYSELFAKFYSQIGGVQFSLLNVLNAGWEGGTVNFLNSNKESALVDISRAGGMAVIVSELPPALVKYGIESGIKINVNSVCPYIGGAMRNASLSSLVKMGMVQKLRTLETFYAQKKYEVEVYEGKTDFGKQYLLKSNVWSGKFGGNMSPYMLTLSGMDEKVKLEKDYESNTPHSISLAEERAYVVFSQAVAKLYDLTNSNSAILHDYHSALSLFYNKRMNPLIIGHNMAYQGILGLNKKHLSSSYRYKDNTFVRRDLSKRLNLSEELIEKYFRAWNTKRDLGCGNILQAVIRRSYEKTGIGSTTVSPGYAEELRWNLQDIILKIKWSLKQDLPVEHFSEEQTIKRVKDFYLSHFDIKISDDEARRFLLVDESRDLDELRTANIVGILNGLDDNKHASKNQILKEMVLNPYNYDWKNIYTPLYLKNEVATDPLFSEGLNFSADYPEKVFKAKSILRKILLMEFFPDKKNKALWENKNVFIHYSWGRLVDQKNVPLIISEAENLTKNGDVLIVIAANPDDRLSREIEFFAMKRSEEMQSQGLHFAFSSSFDTKAYIYAAGADLVHIPSRYEPCGLTDVESYWMGTPVVASMVGGLGKGGYVAGCFSADPSSPESLRLAYRDVYTRAINLKNHFTNEWRDLCLQALRLDFSYKHTANRYIDVLYVAMTKGIMDKALDLAKAYMKGKVDQGLMAELLYIVSGLPSRLKQSYWDMYKIFPEEKGYKPFFDDPDEDAIELLFRQ